MSHSKKRIGRKSPAVCIAAARGALVDTDALTKHPEAARLTAVLDVVEPAPTPDSPLWAGSFGNELRRLGDSAVAELELYASGRAFVHVVSRRDLARSA